MNLASPAPKVEPATADRVVYTEGPIVVEMAHPTEAAKADPARRVSPACTFDDPIQHAPSNHSSAPKTLSSSSLLSVETLRMIHKKNSTTQEQEKQHPLIECYSAVLAGAPTKNGLRRFLPWLFEERDFVSYGEVRKYIVVVNTGTCFVYGDKTDPVPLYGINLYEYEGFIEDPNHPVPYSYTISPITNTNKPRKEMVTVLLRNKVNQKHAYQFTFDTKTIDPSMVKYFMEYFKQ